MKRRVFWAISGVLASLSACDLAPKYQPEKFVLPASYQGAAPWQVAHPQDRIPRGRWWKAYGNPTLNQLEARIPQNPDLLAQRERFMQARYLAAEAVSGLYPHIGANFQVSENRQSPQRLFRSHNNSSAFVEPLTQPDVTASWELDIWKQIGNQVHAEKRLAEAEAANVAAVKLSLQAELANAYITLRGLDQTVQLYRNIIVSYQKALDITQMRLSDRIGSQLDVARAEAQVGSVRAQLNDIVAQRAVAQHAIADLIGVPAASWTMPPQDTTPLTIPLIPTGMPSTLLERRPDIAAAERAMAAANAEIGVAKAAFYPNVSLNAMFGTVNQGLYLFSLPDRAWSIGAAISQPVFEGGLLRAGLGYAKSSYVQTRDQYRSTVLAALQQVEDQLSLSDGLSKEVAENGLVSAATLQAQNLAVQLYTSGATDYVAVVVAQVAYFQAAAGQISNTIRLQQASINLVRALGGGWSADQLPSEKQIVPSNR